MTRFAAQSVTLAVRAWLRNARHARILHVFDHAVNLIAGESVISLVTPRIGNGPFNAVISSDDFPRQIGASDEVRVTPEALTIGDLVIDFSAAQNWNPHPDWQNIRAHAARLNSHVPAIRNALAQHAPANSLAALVVDLPAPESRLDARIVARARQHAHDLHEGALSQNRTLCTLSAKQLAGLGAGLTPAGDDWLLGCALAAHSGFPTPDAAALLLIAVRLAAPGTNPLSASWLRAAVDGACGVHWHRLFAACLYQDVGAVARAAEDIVAQGHSSGADALAGFLAQIVW